MKGLFVQLLSSYDIAVGGHKFEYHYGLASLFGVLKNEGVSCDYRIITPDNQDQLTERFLSRYDFIGVSATSFEINLFNQLNFPEGIPLLVGGVGPTLDPRQFLNHEHPSAVFVGESEKSLVEAIKSLSGGHSIQSSSSVLTRAEDIANIKPVLIKDLNELPFPDREPLLKGVGKKSLKTAEFIFSRGCPFRCTFCATNAFGKLYGKEYHVVRRRSPELAIAEIEQINKIYGPLTCVKFHDDNFLGDKEWTEKFCRIYSQKIRIPFHGNSRAEYIDKDIVSCLAAAGCFELKIGVETGNETIRKRLLGRNQSNQMIKNAIKNVQKVGIKVQANNMIGLPDETERTLQDTISFNTSLKPDMVSLSMYVPIPKTDLYDYCLSKNYIDEKKYCAGFFQKHSPLSQESISQERLQRAFFTVPWQILYPRIAFIPSFLSRIQAGQGKNIMERLIPLLSWLYQLRILLWAKKKHLGMALAAFKNKRQ